MSEYFWVVGSGKKEENMVVFPPLLYCESSVSGKEDPERKKKYFRILKDINDLETACINYSWYMIYGNLTNTHQIESIILSKISSNVVCIISNFFV